MPAADQPKAGQPEDHGALRAAGLSAVVMCCTAMVVAVGDPAPGPLGLFALSAVVGAFRGDASPGSAVAVVGVLLSPLWVYLAALRGWHFVLLAAQILLNLSMVAYVLLHTPPARCDAILLTSLPLALAITFTLHDVLVSLETAERRGAV